MLVLLRTLSLVIIFYMILVALFGGIELMMPHAAKDAIISFLQMPCLWFVRSIETVNLSLLCYSLFFYSLSLCEEDSSKGRK